MTPVLAYGDNALAHANKTRMRIRAYKVVHQEPSRTVVVGSDSGAVSLSRRPSVYH